MRTNHTLRRVRKSSGLGQVLSGTLLSAVMLLQPFGSAWAVDRLSTGQSWFVLNETGIDTLGVQRLRITGPDAEAFTIEGYTGSPTGMTPSQDVFTPALVQKTPSTPLGVNLRFTPQHSGTHQANLEVTHDGSNASPFTYPLTGAGDWDVAAQASTDMVDFGKRTVGMPAVAQDAFVRAVGAHGWLKVTGAKLEGSADFTLAQAGLANKGSTTWGTGANLEVLPIGATESTKAFTAADVSAGGLTDGAMRLRYSPTMYGPQAATLTVYHDGPGGQTSMTVEADGIRGTTVEVTQGNPYSVVTPITDFSRVGLASATLNKSVYLKAGGTVGQVTYSGFKVEGSPDILVTSVGLYGDVYTTPAMKPTCSLNASPVISYTGLPGGGAREASFSLKGGPVQASRCYPQEVSSRITNRPHLQVNLAYLPRTEGIQHAKITIYHDGNDQGFTEFEISGEAFRDVNVEATQGSPYSAAVPVADFPRAKLNAAAQVKTVYLKAFGTYGRVAYKGFKIEGSRDILVTSAGVYGDRGTFDNKGIHCALSVSSQVSYSGQVDGGSQEAQFNMLGDNVQEKNRCVNGYVNITNRPHHVLALKYIPRALGRQTATITIYHDGNAQGFTTFDISGEAY